MKSTNGTLVYARQHKHGLTLPQQSAIDLLASGKTDTETAELLGLSRVAVSKWRLYDPVFQAALNRRRAEVWGAGCERLRALIPKALDTLTDALEEKDSPNRLKAALEVLRLVRLPAPVPAGPTAPEEIVRGLVEARIAAKRAERDRYLSSMDRMVESMHSPFKQEYEAEEREARVEVLAELEAKLSEEGETDAG
jgi:hypothetical protein